MMKTGETSVIGGYYGRGKKTEMKGCFHYRIPLKEVQKEYPRMWMKTRRIQNQAKERVIKGGNGQLCQRQLTEQEMQTVNCPLDLTTRSLKTITKVVSVQGEGGYQKGVN